jgi:hypothetical protein
LRSDTASRYRVVPFGNLRIYRLCAAPRSLSQLTTSFIVSKSQGIHHTPLSALKELLLIYSFLQLVFKSQYVKELRGQLSTPRRVHNRALVRCSGCEPTDLKSTPFLRSSNFKRTKQQHTIFQAIFPYPACGGGYRSRTDDPLRARQML